MSRALGKLITDLGERSTYDAVSQCNRCGYCEQVCPTYVLTGREAFSGRGRNQTVRLLLEGKFKVPEDASAALDTCLLCGACTAACYAHVPTAELVLEGRRLVRGSHVPWSVRVLTFLLLERTRLLELGLKFANLAKRLGLARLVARSGLLHVFGLSGLAVAEEHVQDAPLRFLNERLRKDAALGGAHGAPWHYFAACGSNYLFPRVGEATVKACGAKLGRGSFLDNGCCGLVAFNYGDLEDAREFARRTIARTEATAPGAAPVIADCSSCAAHLKSYPQLFSDDAAWKARADAFSARVRDVLELAPALAPAHPEDERVTYHDSCRARNGQGLVGGHRAALRDALGERFVELPEAEWCCGGAGAFAFSNPGLSDQVARRKVDAVASTQADVVLTSSTSCLLQLAQALRKYYPRAKVMHFSEWAARRL